MDYTTLEYATVLKMTHVSVDGPKGKERCREGQLHTCLYLRRDVECSPTTGVWLLNIRYETTFSREVITRDSKNDGEMVYSDHEIARSEGQDLKGKI